MTHQNNVEGLKISAKTVVIVEEGRMMGPSDSPKQLALCCR
jgi:hypothetical protein